MIRHHVTHTRRQRPFTSADETRRAGWFSLSAMIALCGMSNADVAHSQQVSGFYVGAGVGLAVVGGSSTALDVLMDSALTPVVTNRATFSVGPAVVGSIGWGAGNGSRIALEGSYQNNNQSGGGGASRYGMFVNVAYDFNTNVDWAYPYAGLGVGYEAVSWHAVELQDASGLLPTSFLGGAAGNFAYQFILGVAFPIEAVPGLSVTAEYRYVGLAGSQSYTGSTGATGGFAPAHAHVSQSGSHTVLVGLRYAFDAESSVDPELLTAPAPASNRPAPRTYVVYFDIGSAALNTHARDIVAEAARGSTSLEYTRLEISGHTDRSGDEERNVALSRARAEAVADELVRWGIKRALIQIHAFGDERPLVKTRAGVKEPRNRRVDIVYE